MTRFHGADRTIYTELVQVLHEELDGYGLHLLRADYKQFRDELWSNVCYYMDNADLGIAVFDRFDDLPLSINVSLELGYMLGKGKRCLLLRDVRLPALQADLAGHLCHEIDQRDIAGTVRGRVREWLRDLGIAKRPGERLVIFVSYGGTCRDPMAKAILEQIMKQSPPPFPLRVEARGLYPHRKSASIAARKAVEEAYGSDLLASHRPQRLADGYIAEADLILTMNSDLKKVLPTSKTFVINEYFGLGGDVANPWPDGTDEHTTQRYAACLSGLRQILEDNYPMLICRLADGIVASYSGPAD